MVPSLANFQNNGKDESRYMREIGTNFNNRLRSISNLFDKRWLGLLRESFKPNCKMFAVQSQLQLLT